MYIYWDDERRHMPTRIILPPVTHSCDHACMPSKMAFPPSTPRSFQLRSKWVTVPSARLVKKTAGWKTVGKNCTELPTSLSWWKHHMLRWSVKYSESGMWNTFTATPSPFQNLKITRILSRLQHLFSPGAVVTQHVTNERTAICSNLVVPRLATRYEQIFPSTILNVATVRLSPSIAIPRLRRSTWVMDWLSSVAMINETGNANWQKKC